MKPVGRSRTRALAALGVGATLAVCVHCGVSIDDVLCLAPALALAIALLARRYPGERLLTALAARHRARRRPALTASDPTLAHVHARVPRGGLLMAFALAVRPPPAAALSS